MHTVLLAMQRLLPFPTHQQLVVVTDIKLQGKAHSALSIQRWLPLFTHHRLVALTDKSTAFHSLRHRSVRGPAMNPLRTTTLLAALQDIEVQPP